MSSEEPRDEIAEQPSATEMLLAYAGPSRLLAVAGSAALSLVGDLRRVPVRLDARVQWPLPLREALSVLYAVVGSDYRYVPKDRTAYLAYLHMKKEAAGLGIQRTQGIAQAASRTAGRGPSPEAWQAAEGRREPGPAGGLRCVPPHERSPSAVRSS